MWGERVHGLCLREAGGLGCLQACFVQADLASSAHGKEYPGHGMKVYKAVNATLVSRRLELIISADQQSNDLMLHAI